MSLATAGVIGPNQSMATAGGSRNDIIAGTDEDYPVPLVSSGELGKWFLYRAVIAEYVAAQCLGAICGAGLARAFHGGSCYMRFGRGANELDAGYSRGVGLAAEISGTFVLVYTVFSAKDPKRVARDAHLATIPITDTGINPARSLGPAVVYHHRKAWEDQWMFWVGPLIGAAVAVLYQQFVLRAGADKAFAPLRKNLA